MSIKTHYETLNVARDAPSDVIRAAYKAITQKFNAEHYPSADASRLMKSIHDSYAVLSNPLKRAEYDRWLLERESAEVGKGFIGNTDTPKSANSRWLLFGAIGISLLSAIGWLLYSSSSLESKPEQLPPNVGSAAESGAPVQIAPTQTVLDAQPAEDTRNAPVTQRISIPNHDKAAVGDFIGAWKGDNGDTAGQQTLNISLKSPNSLVFRLNAKAGQNIGEVYGVAEFENNSAQFYNKEYGCNILLTIKSGVLRLDTSSCQEYHETGVSFDGLYIKPAPVKAELKPVPRKPKPEPPKNMADSENLAQQVEPAPTLPANTPKLRKFSATVKDSDGNVNSFELIAKDKEAARAIIRDFRGNPKIMKLKELKK